MKFAYPSGSRPLEGYTVKRGIGRGGFGEVYYATSDAGKEVALKLIRRNLDIELRGVTQCLNLKHPNLLALFDIRQDDQGDSWVVMEYVGGECLEQVVARHPHGMPVPEMLAWMHGLSAAVAYLHDHGIVHRDLKPGNIFSDEGLVKVGDYGLSKFISCSRRSGQTGSVGTVHYMAPEVANGRYGKEIDIYALGIILYEMLTGHVPFEGESVGEVLMKHLTAEPNLSALAEPYRTIVGRALTKDPERRFKTVSEMVALLPRPALQSLGSPGLNESPTVFYPPSTSYVGQPVAASPQPAGLMARAMADEEPVWKAIRESAFEIRAWWERKNFTALQKVPLLVLGVYLLAVSFPAWIFALLFGTLTYGGYRIIRAIVIATEQQRTPRPQPQAYPAVVPMHAPPAPQQPMPAAEAAPDPAPASPTLKRWRPKPVPVIETTPREKLTELTGSLLLSALVTAVTSVVMLVLRGEPLEGNQYVWLAVTSTIGAWAVMIPSKAWEGSRGDASLRRFMMMVVGLLLALVAYGLFDALMVKLPYHQDVTLPSFASREMQTNFYGSDGGPLLLAFLAYFSFLFLVPRWWYQADPMRSSRLSLWSTAVCVFWAAALNLFWPFPQPWGMMLAATISIAVQLSSVWVAPPKRRARGAIERAA